MLAPRQLSNPLSGVGVEREPSEGIHPHGMVVVGPQLPPKRIADGEELCSGLSIRTLTTTKVSAVM